MASEDGRVDTEDRCGCGFASRLNEEFDALYCPKCDKWLEEPCGYLGIENCRFNCAERPDKPSMVGK